MAYTFSDDELKKFTFSKDELSQIYFNPKEPQDKKDAYVRLYQEYHAANTPGVKESQEAYAAKYHGPLIENKKNQKNLQNFKSDQWKFLNTLAEPEKTVLGLYTHEGDRIINGLLRTQGIEQRNDGVHDSIYFGIKNVPEPIKDIVRRGGDIETIVPSPSEIRKKPLTEVVGNLRPFLSKFLNTFQKVPVLKEELKVYRGVKGISGLKLDDVQFLSTSYDRKVASNFISGSTCCMLNITLQPGVRALYIEPLSQYKAEQEILVGPPFVATIQKNPSPKDENLEEYDVVISPRKSKGGRTYRRKKTAKKTHRRKFKQ
jgi:hypothetical protein